MQTSHRINQPQLTPDERQRRRMRVRKTIERLSRSARGGGPLTPSQAAELDAMVRELNELDAADRLDER